MLVIGIVTITGCVKPTIVPVRSRPADVGRVLTYVRSNADGTEAETIHVHRASLSRIEVIKVREKCTNAAFVIADVSPATGEVTELRGFALARCKTRNIRLAHRRSGHFVDAHRLPKRGTDSANQDRPTPMALAKSSDVWNGGWQVALRAVAGLPSYRSRRMRLRISPT